MWRIAVLILAALIVTTTVQAKPRDDKQPGAAQYSVAEQGTAARREAFSPAERNLIRAHLLGKQAAGSPQIDQTLPPGLQKKLARGKALPPGWQKKLAPGQSLDYRVYRQGESLPDALLRRLSPPPVGSEILQVDDWVVRINAATRTILDAFDLTPATD